MMPQLKLLRASKSKESYLFFNVFLCVELDRFLAAGEDGLGDAKMLKN